MPSHHGTWRAGARFVSSRPWAFARCAFAFVLALNPVLIAQGTQRTSVCRVGFRVVGVFGRLLPYHVSAFKDTETGRDFASFFGGSVADNIPKGTYLYRLERDIAGSSIGLLSGTVRVSDPELWFTVETVHTTAVVDGLETAVDYAREHDFVLRGSVTPVSAQDRPIWIRIQSLYREESLEARVDPTGEFRLYKPLLGNYLVIVFQGERVVHTQVVTLHGEASKQMAIRLPRKPPPPADVE